MSPSRDKIKLQRITHVRYAHADMDKACEFLRDFGFVEVEARDNSSIVYFRGYGTAPFVYSATKADKNEFLGAAFVVESMDDLELASKTLPHATEVQKLDSPGGGHGVSFKDPVDGFPFHLVYGQEEAELNDTQKELAYNFPNAKHRPANNTQRFKKGPAPVHKLGHFGFCTSNFAAMFDFVTSHFNLKPSDIIYDDNGTDVTTFLHLDRGKEWVDHHTFFFYQGPKAHMHHSSFEVHDFDVQLLGHHWLEEKKYDLVWGVGRHVMGSQIFDYWYDPSRFIMEHYVDGDLVNDETPIGRSKAAPDNLHVWGPEVPATFLD